MRDLLKNLVPQGRRGLAWWFILLLLFYGLYYFGGPYSLFERWYYDDERQPERVQYYSGTKSSLPVTITHIRIVKPIADFMESEVVITAKNVTTQTQTAIVGIDVVTTTALTAPAQHPRVYIRTPLITRSQNTVILEHIPPRAQVRANFMVRIADGERGCEYPLNFRVNEEDFEPNTEFAFLYAPFERLQMWLVENLLLPPGADIALPVTTMLFVVWLVDLCTDCKTKRLRLKGRGYLKSLIPRILFTLIVMGFLMLSVPKVGPLLSVVFFLISALFCYLPDLRNYLSLDQNIDIIAYRTRIKSGTVLKPDQVYSRSLNDVAFVIGEKDLVVGKTLKRDVSAGAPVLKDDIK